MKRVSKLGIALAVLVMTSCSKDFLDLDNKTQLSNDSFWQTEKQVQYGLIAAYAALQTETGDKWDFFEQVYIGLTYRGDDINNNQAEAYGAKLAAFTFTTDESTVRKLWQTSYAGIARANQVIQRVPGVNEKELSAEAKSQYIGEAKFLRAYNYFMLVNLFGNVPKSTTYAGYGDSPSAEGDLRPEQVSPSEIWALIEADLKEAESTIVDEQPADWKGRVTKWTAKALLAKAYLFQEKWPEAEAKFREVVEQGPYDLLPDYADNFNGKGENGIESLFEVQFTANREGGVDERTPFNYEVAPGALDGWQLFYPSDWLMTEMMNDKTATGEFSERVYESVYFDDPNSVMKYADGDEKATMAKVRQDKEDDDVFTFPYYFKKYSEYTDRNGSYVGTNINVMRFADVLLMYAEALNENNKTTEAIAQINRVRDRSNAAPLTTMSKDALRNQIRHHERPVELAMEWGIRWMDLVRWDRGNTAKEPIRNTLTVHGKEGAVNFQPGKHELNPIPYQETTLNKNLNQNTGW